MSNYMIFICLPRFIKNTMPMDETKYKICILFRFKIPQDRGTNAIMS